MLKQLSGAVALRVVGYLYQPLLVPLLVVLLGLPGYGNLSAALAVATISIAFCEYGHGSTLGTRIASRIPEDRDYVASLYYPTTFYQKLLLLLIAVGGILIWAEFYSDYPALDFFLLSVVIMCVITPEVLTPTWYYIGTGHLTHLLIYQLAGRAVAFILLGWLAYQSTSISTATAAVLCGLPFVVCALLSNVHFWRRARPVFKRPAIRVLLADLANQSPFSLGTFTCSVTPAVFLLVVADRFSAEILGQYAIAGVAWGALRQMSQMGANIALVTDGITGPRRTLRRAFFGSALGMTCAGMTVIGINFILHFPTNELWLEPSYKAAGVYLAWLACSVIFFALNFTFSLHVLCANRRSMAFTLCQSSPIAAFLAIALWRHDLSTVDLARGMVIAEIIGALLALSYACMDVRDRKHDLC